MFTISSGPELLEIVANIYIFNGSSSQQTWKRKSWKVGVWELLLCVFADQTLQTIFEN